jgi:hypothetical protein
MGMVYEKRGETDKAVDCYFKALAVAVKRPDDFEPDYITHLLAQIKTLDPTYAV